MKHENDEKSAQNEKNDEKVKKVMFRNEKKDEMKHENDEKSAQHGNMKKIGKERNAIDILMKNARKESFKETQKKITNNKMKKKKERKPSIELRKKNDEKTELELILERMREKKKIIERKYSQKETEVSEKKPENEYIVEKKERNTLTKEKTIIDENKIEIQLKNDEKTLKKCPILEQSDAGNSKNQFQCKSSLTTKPREKERNGLINRRKVTELRTIFSPKVRSLQGKKIHANEMMSSPGKRKRNSNVEVQETATSVQELIGKFGLGNQTKRLKVEEEASYGNGC